MQQPGVSDRAGYLGGSDAAVVLGVSPWTTQMELCAVKRGIEVPRGDRNTDALFFFGHLLEPAIGEAVGKIYPSLRPKALLTEDGSPKFFRSKVHPFMGGHLDFALLAENGKDTRAFLECKNVRFASKEWGAMREDPLEEDASGSIPKYYLAQCRHYMVVRDSPYCFLAALFGGNELRLYRIDRDKKAEDALVRAEQNFWERYVLGDDLPEPQTADDYVLILNALLVSEGSTPKNKRVVMLDPSLSKSVVRLAQIRADEAKLGKEAKAIRDEIIIACAGGNATLADPQGEILGSVVSQSRSSADLKRFEKEQPAAFALYETFKKQSAYFVVRTAGEK